LTVSQGLPTPLVSAAQLEGLLAASSCLVFDCRFVLPDPPAGHSAYMRGHIPGARYAHLDHDLSRPPHPYEGRHPLPEPLQFAATLGRLGITARDRVVVYDDQSGAIAARLWWMLRWLGHEEVAVLDGGLQAWIAAGGRLEAGGVDWQLATYEPGKVRSAEVVTTAEIAALDTKRAVLVDARAPARFAGREEPIDPVAGHVPGAVNWPFSSMLDPDGRMQPPERIRERYMAVTDGGTRELVAMCGSGVTACHILLAVATAGLPGRLYAGSWSEWIRDPARPIARG